MKKSLKLITKYILYLVIGSLLGTIFYYIYSSIQRFVPGGYGQKIFIGDFLRTYFKVLAYLVFIIPTVLICHKLKRPGTVLQCITFILISALSWMLILPFSYKGYKNISKTYSEEQFYNPLSKGEFRQSDNKVYYFASDYNSDAMWPTEVASVVIDTNEEGGVTVEKILEKKDFELITAANPYRDILIKDFFTSKSQVYLNLDSILKRMDDASNQGFTFLLGFMTLGFVLCSIYGLANISSWRLINSSVVIFTTVAVLCFNNLYYTPAGEFLRESSIASIYSIQYLENFVNDPILCLINLIFGFIFIIVGILRFIFSSRAAKKAKKVA